MSGWWHRLTERLTGGLNLPAGFGADLEAEEHVVAIAGLRGGGHLVATSLGVLVSEADGVRRVGWHLVSKAIWKSGVLTLTVAGEVGQAGGAVLLEDQPPRRYALAQVGKLPDVVHARVTGSIKSSHRQELPGGGAWFVQRKIPGQDGVTLQVRADPGTDPAAVQRVAAEVARRIAEARPQL